MKLNNSSQAILRQRANEERCEERRREGERRGFSCNPYSPFQARMTLFENRELNEAFSRHHPHVYTRKVAVRGEGMTMPDGNACTRLQDEINTILCKRARLIVRGKASGISGIPNKLTLNAEGSPPPPFHLRVPSVSSRAPTLLNG